MKQLGRIANMLADSMLKHPVTATLEGRGR
jgi:hypothetical protein